MRNATDTHTSNCYHCGDKCVDELVVFDERNFCCNGCKSVYELLKSCEMESYYKYAETPGIKKLKSTPKSAFAYLDNQSIVEQLVSFSSPDVQKITFRLPAIHCASCIWLIEHFHKLVDGVLSSRVNFIKREASFTYNPQVLSLRTLVEQLATIGYEPDLKFDQTQRKSGHKVRRTLIYQIGVAGFCFGNIMLLSFPEYLGDSLSLDGNYRAFFGYMNFSLALPVLFFSAKDYLLSAWRAVVHRKINMDVPISMGILALFLRSTFEIFVESGGGYMDSLAALVFFLLIGKWIQQKSYDSLSFERDYKSYFPISVQRIEGDEESAVGIEEVEVGDRINIRSGELIPFDGALVSGDARIDYSFVTGESSPVRIAKGEKVFAGGRQTGSMISLEVEKKVNQSYLTSLWNESEGESEKGDLETFADRVGEKFTWAIVAIASTAALFWLIVNPSIALNALSAVLIVACPCALALSFPFAFGNANRLMGRKGLYLKNGKALGAMSEITDIVFDKTGTLTRKGQVDIDYIGRDLTQREVDMIQNITSQSGHPLSRYISAHLKASSKVSFEDFIEFSGKGIEATYEGDTYQIGSATFVGHDEEVNRDGKSRVYIAVNGDVLGVFTVAKSYHENLSESINSLKDGYNLYLVSGDNDNERQKMTELFGNSENLFFNKLPHEKEEIVESLGKDGKNVAMIGDGLNDAAALKAAHFGISVADDVFRFSPASDAILSSDSFPRIHQFFAYARSVKRLVQWSFVFSFLYNGIGLVFAVSGNLTPVVAAILMPVSSITVVGFVTIGSRFLFSKYFNEKSVNAKTDKYQFVD